VGWDREGYRRDVLDPARRSGNVPPPDLYVRYGLPGDISDPGRFAEHIAAVLRYWRELANNRTYAPLAQALITAHGALERNGRLTPRRFAEGRAHARQESMERLRRLADTEAGAATHAGPATVTRLRDAAGGTVSNADVAAALRAAGVRVVREFPHLPPAPHPKQADLARYLKPLGRSLSAEVVFGTAVADGFRLLRGFRLADGRALDAGAISAAQGRVGALPYTDPAKAPSENVLAILRTAAREPGDLDTLLLSEVVEPLRQLARAGFLQRGIASQAAELGLDEDEAGLIAAAVLAPDTLESLRQQVTNELARGRLRSAQRLGAGLPAADPLHERLAALDARMHEVYFAAYEHDGARWLPRLAPGVAAPGEVPLPEGEGWSGVGNGFAAYPALRERLAAALASCDTGTLPSAIAIGALALPRLAAGDGIPARDAAPLYVRHRVALTSAERALGARL